MREGGRGGVKSREGEGVVWGEKLLREGSRTGKRQCLLEEGGLHRAL